MSLDFLYEYLGDGKLTTKGDEIRFNCPFCGDRKKRFFVNVYTHLVWCHNCEYGVTLVKLLADLTGVSYREAYKIYKEHEGITHMPTSVKDEVFGVLCTNNNAEIEKSAVPLPDYFSSLSGNKSHLGKLCRRYLHNRGVTDRQIDFHKFGFCYDGQYSGRVILPISIRKQIRFWVARSINKEEKFQKELSPSVLSYQYGKTEVIFNLDQPAILYNYVVLTEGFFDALTFGDEGAGLLGKTLYDDQVALLLSYKDELSNGIYIALDEDAWRQSLDVADVLFKAGFQTFLCKIRDDPNALGREGCIRAKKNAIEYSPLYRVKGLFN